MSNLDRLPGDRNVNVGTIRTAFTALISLAAIWVASVLSGSTVDTDNPLTIAAGTVLWAAVYAVSRVIAGRWPRVAPFLFGITTPPRYDD